jgi:hypothetical protein
MTYITTDENIKVLGAEFVSQRSPSGLTLNRTSSGNLEKIQDVK